MAPQYATAPVSPYSSLRMRRNTAAFSASRCPAVTRKPSSGGGGSLRGHPVLRGSRQTLRFRGLALSRRGERDLQVRFRPFAASARFVCCWRFWEGTAAREEGGGPSRLGRLVLRAGGKPRVEL